MAESVWKKTLGIFGFGSEEDNESTEQENFVENKERLFSRKKKFVSFSANKTSEIVVFEPDSYEEVQNIADNLKIKRAIIVNLQSLDSEQAKRIVDFISGVIYAIEGQMQKISDSIFLFAPNNVEVIPEKIPKNNNWIFK